MTTTQRTRIQPMSLAIGALAGCGLAVAVLAGGLTKATTAMELQDEVRLGTYEPQRAFQEYHGTQAFNQQVQEMQQQMQEAQQQGDQQRMMEIQQRMQQEQDQIIQKFYADIDKVVPEIAESAGVQIIALEIVYADTDFGDPKDLTDQLISKVNESANAGAEREPEPEMPW